MASISEFESKFEELELEAANLKAQWELKTIQAAACYKVLQRLRTESAKTEAEEAMTNVKKKVKEENSSSSSEDEEAMKNVKKKVKKQNSSSSSSSSSDDDAADANDVIAKFLKDLQEAGVEEDKISEDEEDASAKQDDVVMGAPAKHDDVVMDAAAKQDDVVTDAMAKKDEADKGVPATQVEVAEVKVNKEKNANKQKTVDAKVRVKEEGEAVKKRKYERNEPCPVGVCYTCWLQNHLNKTGGPAHKRDEGCLKGPFFNAKYQHHFPE